MAGCGIKNQRSGTAGDVQYRTKGVYVVHVERGIQKKKGSALCGTN